ncbi:hypothetical protein OG948_06010 [Embleya sp. NBC_00888]|nr:hypothetical protein OG948_06010 [Embleya sp. NBC_00888]
MDGADRADRAGIDGVRVGIDDADRPNPPDHSDHPVCVEVEPADREFAATLERLGIEMPRDLAPGVLAGYRGLRAKMELLRTMETTDG